ncbi:SMI1/KNR4 family protein [Streptomyces sp. NPDC051214]|uniref:SMI1/KNR4 family protein n=1 Tax=Streptomyces sp. NPDC051214 TaxID=3155282 RepID=UPI003417D4F9
MTQDMYLRKVMAMLGEPPRTHQRKESWQAIEEAIGTSLPVDYKEIVDGYGPLHINGHLYLHHPATEPWNLGKWMRDTAEAWSQIEFDEDEPEGDPCASLGVSELVFGTSDGLIPLFGTDRSEMVFYGPKAAGGKGSLFVEPGEGEFFEYEMGVAEWFYRWLVGEHVTGPHGGVYYPGPVVLRDLPMTPDDRPEPRFGPRRQG